MPDNIFKQPTVIFTSSAIGPWDASGDVLDIYNDVENAIRRLPDEPSYLLMSNDTRNWMDRLDYDRISFSSRMPELFNYDIPDGCNLAKDYFIRAINRKILRTSNNVSNNQVYLVSYNNNIVIINIA